MMWGKLSVKNSFFFPPPLPAGVTGSADTRAAILGLQHFHFNNLHLPSLPLVETLTSLCPRSSSKLWEYPWWWWGGKWYQGQDRHGGCLCSPETPPGFRGTRPCTWSHTGG